MKKLLLLFVFFASQLFAQENPVSWTFESKKVSDCEYDLIFKAEIKEPWHIYSIVKNTTKEAEDIWPTTIVFKNSAAFVKVGNLKESKPTTEFDKVWEAVVSFHPHKATFTQRIKLLTAEKVKIKGNCEAQACTDVMCTRPPVEPFEFELQGSGACVSTEASFGINTSANSCVCDTDAIVSAHDNKSKITASADTAVKATEATIRETPKDTANDCNPWSTLFIGLGFGLGAVLMPCIYSLIPLTVSFFLKQSKTKASGIKNSLLYGFFIILIFVALTMGITVIFGPAALSNIATNTWLNLFFFVLFVVFALSFFGLFEITLPNSWANKMDAKSDKGGAIGIFFMALTLVIVSFSCTVGFMGTLINAVARGDSYLCPLMGFSGFGAGIALPFMLFAFFPSWLKSLPKSGGWMTTFKVTVAFLELALAVKFLANADNVNEWGFITREVFISLWIGIFAMLTFYLLGVFRTSHDDPKTHLSVGRILWATIFLAFTIYIIPGMWGAPLKLISSFPPPHHYAESPDGFGGSGHAAPAGSSTDTNSEAGRLEGKRITGPNGLKIFKDDYESALRYANLTGKPLFVDFTGLACVNCRLMESKIWVLPGVFEILKDQVVIVSLYVDSKVDLPESEVKEVFWYGKNRRLSTVGDKWSYYQNTNFKNNSQPMYVMLDAAGNTISDGVMGTELDDKVFKSWLAGGVSRFKK